MICKEFIPKSLLQNGKISLRNLVAANKFKPYSKDKAKLCEDKGAPGVPHPPKDPPPNYNPKELRTECFEAPTNVQLLVFRPLQCDDVLGPNAGKSNKYKNPEYYAYHRYSFVDLHKNAMRIRMENRMLEMCPYAIPRRELEQCEGDDNDEQCECDQDKGSNGKGRKSK